MKPLLLICIPLIITLAANCQDLYVTNSGDTIHGRIANYTEWDKNPKEVIFIENSSKTTTLTPQACKRFSVGKSDKYISYSGPRTLNSMDIVNTYGLKSNIKTTELINAFLREIYQYREITLYEYVDNKRTNFFLGKNDSIKELEYFEYSDDNGNIKTDDSFKIYILNQFSNNNDPDLMNKINSLSYNENSLIYFFSNIMKDKTYKTIKKRIKYPAEIFIGAGIDAGIGTGVGGDGSNDRQTTVAPLLEIGMRIYGQRNFGKFFIQPSLMASTFNQHFTELYHIAFKAQGTIMGIMLGPGYTFIKKSKLSFYAIIPFGVDFIFGYQTSYTGNLRSESLTYFGTPSKFILKPEVGLNLNHKIDIALQGPTLFKLPQLPYDNLPYKYITFGLNARYIF